MLHTKPQRAQVDVKDHYISLLGTVIYHPTYDLFLTVYSLVEMESIKKPVKYSYFTLCITNERIEIPKSQAYSITYPDLTVYSLDTITTGFSNATQDTDRKFIGIKKDRLSDIIYNPELLVLKDKSTYHESIRYTSNGKTY